MRSKSFALVTLLFFLFTFIPVGSGPIYAFENVGPRPELLEGQPYIIFEGSMDAHDYGKYLGSAGDQDYYGFKYLSNCQVTAVEISGFPSLDNIEPGQLALKIGTMEMDNNETSYLQEGLNWTWHEVWLPAAGSEFSLSLQDGSSTRTLLQSNELTTVIDSQLMENGNPVNEFLLAYTEGVLEPTDDPFFSEFTGALSNEFRMEMLPVPGYEDLWIQGDPIPGVANGYTYTFRMLLTAKNWSPSSNADLCSLEVSPGTLDPAFDPSIVNYVVYEANEIENILVTPVAVDATATVQVISGDGADITVEVPDPSVSVSLAEGENWITVRVNSLDGHSKDYFLQVNRDYTPTNTTILDIGEAVNSSKEFYGWATDEVSGKMWPCILTFTSYDPAGGTVVGQINWTSINSINQIEGNVNGNILDFAETAYIQEGPAILGCLYSVDLTIDENNRFYGNWNDPDPTRNEYGPIWFGLEEIFTDEDSVTADTANLEIEYAEGDSADSVTRDIGLPVLGECGSNISWETSDANIIATDGTVVRSVYDTAVLLTATISKGTSIDSKPFVLVVKGTGMQFHILQADPRLVEERYQDLTMTLTDALASGLWNVSDTLSLEISKMVFDPANPLSPPEKQSVRIIDSGVTVSTDAVSYTLEAGLDRGLYEVDVIKCAEVLATGRFIVLPPLVTVEPTQLPAGYVDQTMTVIDSTPGQDLWSSGEHLLSLGIFAGSFNPESSNDLPLDISLTHIYGLNLTVHENDLQFCLEEGYAPGGYTIGVFRGTELIAVGGFAITPPQLSVNPDCINAGETPLMTLTDITPQQLLWTCDDDLLVEIFNFYFDPDNPGIPPIKNILTTITQADLFIYENDIEFELPFGLQPGEYSIGIFNDTSLLAGGQFNVEDNHEYFPKAWLSTDGLGEPGYSSVRAPFTGGYLNLSVNMEDVHFTSATFTVDYDSQTVADPVFWDPVMRDDLTVRDIVYIEDLGEGRRRATVNISGDVYIDADPDTYDSTLFTLSFYPVSEGTVPLALYPQECFPAEYVNCSLEVFDGSIPLQYTPLDYNDDLVLFAFTDKDYVSYYYDYITGEPLTNGTIEAAFDTEEGPVEQVLDVSGDPYGGYFFDNVDGAAMYNIRIPGYYPEGPANYYWVSHLEPIVMMAQPNPIVATDDDVMITVELPEIGVSFAADRFSANLYYRDEDGRTHEVVDKTFAFEAGANQDEIKMTFVGGLQLLTEEPWQDYDVYLKQDGDLLGRICLEVKKPELILNPSALEAAYEDTEITLDDGGQGLWSAGDILDVKIYELDSADTEYMTTSERVPLRTLSGLTAGEGTLTFTLAAGLEVGKYEVEVWKGAAVLTVGKFVIHRALVDAVNDGLNWLVDQQKPGGFWGTEYTVAKTGLAVLDLEIANINQNIAPGDAGYLYPTNIEKGLKYLFANAHTVTLSDQYHDGIADNPDTNGNEIGIYFTSPLDGPGHSVEIYETSIALMAIAASENPTAIVNVPGSAVNGWTYRDVLQDGMDYLAWAQVDASYGRGGWNYQPCDNNNEWPRADQSNSGWVTLALAYAEAPEYGFACTIPGFVRSELDLWIDAVQVDSTGEENDGGAAYVPPTDPDGHWSDVNILKTGNLLQQMAFVGDTVSTSRVLAALEYMVRHWNDPNWNTGWKGDSFMGQPTSYHATYTVMKGFEALAISTLGSAPPIDWYWGFRKAILPEQHADGSWPTSYMDNAGDYILSTEWALLTLQKSTAPTLVRPDLKILEVNMEWVPATTGDYRVKYEVLNRGNADSPDNVSIELRVDGQVEATDVLPVLVPGGSCNGQFNYLGTVSATNYIDEIIVEIDGQNTLPELNKYNNHWIELWPRSISGLVYEAGGTGTVPGAWVEAKNVDTQETVRAGVNNQGDYVIAGLQSGEYLVTAGAPGYGLKYWDNTTIKEQATLLTVTLTNEIQNINFNLEKIASGDLLIQTTSLPSAMVGIGYNAPLIASGGTGSYNWTVSQGVLPPGIELLNDNEMNFYLGGTPTAGGSYTFTLTVEDQDSQQTASEEYVLQVEENTSAVLNNLTLSAGTLNPAFNSYIDNYTADVENEVLFTDVSPTAADPGATVTVNGVVYDGANPVRVNLNVGTNPITVIVSLNGEQKTYTVTVNRKAEVPAGETYTLQYLVNNTELFNEILAVYTLDRLTVMLPVISMEQITITYTSTVSDFSVTAKPDAAGIDILAGGQTYPMIYQENNIFARGISGLTAGSDITFIAYDGNGNELERKTMRLYNSTYNPVIPENNQYSLQELVNNPVLFNQILDVFTLDKLNLVLPVVYLHEAEVSYTGAGTTVFVIGDSEVSKLKIIANEESYLLEQYSTDTASGKHCFETTLTGLAQGSFVTIRAYNSSNEVLEEIVRRAL